MFRPLTNYAIAVIQKTVKTLFCDMRTMTDDFRKSSCPAEKIYCVVVRATFFQGCEYASRSTSGNSLNWKNSPLQKTMRLYISTISPSQATPLYNRKTSSFGIIIASIIAVVAGSQGKDDEVAARLYNSSNLQRWIYVF